MTLTKEVTEKLIQRLEDVVKLKNSKGFSGFKCPVCTNDEFTVMQGYMLQNIRDNLKRQLLSSASIPSIVSMCNNSGYMLNFALGSLGLIKNKRETVKPTKIKCFKCGKLQEQKYCDECEEDAKKWLPYTFLKKD